MRGWAARNKVTQGSSRGYAPSVDTESHDHCTPTELANWNKVSRQTVYNWRDRGLLVYDGRRINVPGTVALWKFLIKLR